MKGMTITTTSSDSRGKMTPEEKALLRQVFQVRPDSPCEDCGGYHLSFACRRVKSQRWLGNGNRVKVKYWKDGEWDESSVIYPDDIFDPEGGKDADD
jgi:hypothetical protein